MRNANYFFDCITRIFQGSGEQKFFKTYILRNNMGFAFMSIIFKKADYYMFQKFKGRLYSLN